MVLDKVNGDVCRWLCVTSRGSGWLHKARVAIRAMKPSAVRRSWKAPLGLAYNKDQVSSERRPGFHHVLEHPTRMGHHRFGAIPLTLALSLGVVAGCGGADPRTVRFGAYVSQLCEAVGPFERDAQTFGRVLGRYSLALRSRKS